MSVRSAVIAQVINGVPFPMEYTISIPGGIDLKTASSGTITASPNNATLSGVYDYTPASADGSTASSLSFSLTCTVGGNPGPQANSSTIFNGTLCDAMGVFIGSLRGIPPFSSPSTFQFDFAEGTFLLIFGPEKVESLHKT